MMKTWFVRTFKLKDLWAVVIVFGLALALSFIYINKARDNGAKPFFYQSYYEPAIRMACGQDFGVEQAGQLSQEMTDFLQLKRDTLSCNKVKPATVLNSNPGLRVWYHLFVTTALVWKVAGISWQALDALAAVLLSLSAVIVYAIMRLWMPVSVAAILAIVSILPGRGFLLYMRDLGKAPFILVSLFAVGLLVTKELSRRRLYLLMAVTGACLGIGYGFRPDVLIGLPLLIIAAVFFRPVSCKYGWIDGIVGSALLLCAFATAASPIFPVFLNKVGNCHWHFALLGLSEEHTRSLGLAAAQYSMLTHYDDGLVAGTVVSYAERALSMPWMGYCTPEYDIASRSLYFDLISTFSGDFFARALSASKYVLGFGLGVRAREVHDTLFSVDKISVVLWAVTVFVLLIKNLRLGIFSVFALAYLCAYPVIQFDNRHYFHLAFLGLVPIGLGLSWLLKFIGAVRKKGFTPWTLPATHPSQKNTIRAFAIVTGMIALVLLAFFIAQQRQISTVNKLIDEYLAASGDPAIRGRSDLKNGEARFLLPGFTTVDPSIQKSFSGRMLRIDLGGKDCSAGRRNFEIELSGPNPSYQFKKIFQVDVDPNRSAAIFLPVYFQYAQLSNLSERDMRCIVDARWLHSYALPSLWITAVLYPKQ